MKKKFSIPRLILFIQLLFVFINSNAQTGLNFQGVARTSNNVILASQPISLRLSILQGSASGTTEYAETRKVTTNAQGLFSVVIGDTDASSSIGNFSTINWKNTPKFLKIEMDAAAGNNYITMGTTQFQYVAYAQFASSVDADNIAGIVPIAKGGTGVTSLASLKAALAIDKTSIGLSNVDNTTDLLKPISTATQTVLDIKANTSDVSNSLANKVDKINGKDLSTNDYTTAEKTKLAAITGTNTGDQDLSSYATTSALALKVNASDLTTSLALKENVSNKSSAADLGGVSPSDVLFPTQKAVKDYVTANNSGGGVSDGGITTIKIADAAVTDAKINTVSGSKVIGNITGNAATATTAGNITATTNTTLTSISSLATVGTITSGVWSGTAVAVEKGGTGATTASAARTNLGLVIGTNVQAPLVAGIDYLAPTGSAASLTNFPTFNQNTTGNAATATTAGNITATTNTTLTSISSLATVGTITSGVWSGTAVAVEKGGTGATTASAARTNLGLVIGTDVQAPLVAGTNYLTPTGSAASLTNFPTFNQNTTGNAATATTAGNITATTNTTLTSISSLATVGTITSGVWSGTAVAVEKGGTGATTASAARTNLGLVIGTNVQAPLVAGIDYLAPTGSAASLTNFPTFNQSTTGNAATATTAGNITATANTTLTSLSSLATVGTITSGVWSGTAVAVEKGGTGATTASAARTNLGLVIGTDVQAPLVAGTNYLTPTGSAASLTNFPTFNQNTTGNAATATTAGNITATANTTLTSLSSLATVGTITSGTWSGTAVAVEKGGTGATTASAARTNLGLVIGTNVQAPLVAGIDYLAPTGSAASLTNFPTFNQSTTGNAATATTAGNITATTNTTLTSLSNLATVGTITSGVWSGTAVAVEKGGTGLTSAGTNGQVLTSIGSGTLTWTGTHYIGESYGGGIVFYVYDNGKHGLIAATSDQSTGIRWYGGSNTNTRSRADGVGAGLKNTAIIIANQGAVDGNAFAATVCNEYFVTVDGVTYGDWYLPSKYELNLMYTKIGQGAPSPNTNVGGFADDHFYWSSTEYATNVAWDQYFTKGGGGQIYDVKGFSNYVRAVRAF